MASFGTARYGTDLYGGYGGPPVYDVTSDNYKSKLTRRHFPPPYDTRRSSNLGKLLTVIATSDNAIGGLFGAADFLPDEDL